ncbi:response regulator [Paraglaciecola marina]|uniref:response regulator n=1 Tax=Paraglaciecola marina TaxID=2500157 RepID=UPI0010622D7A|nr:response regulator [Paraglaciecola marina]
MYYRSFKFVSFLTLFAVMLGQSLFAATTDNIPSIKLSNLNDHNVTEQISYFSLLGNSQALPRNKATLEALISSLQPHTDTNLSGDKYVAVFELNNDTQQTEWFIYPYGSVVQHIEIFCYDCNKFNETVKSGHGLNNQQDFHYGSKIEIDPGQRKTIAILFDSPYFFSPITIVVKPFEQTVKLFHIENVLLLIGLGISLALGIYNLFIFTSTHNYQYLTYALSTLSYGTAWAIVFAVPHYLGFENSLIFGLPAFLIGSIFTCFFNIQFLQLDKVSPKIALALKIVALIALISIPFAFYNYETGLYLATFSTSLTAFIGIYTGVRCWINGYSPAKYYTLALLSVALPNMVVNLINIEFLPRLNINIYLLGLIGNCLDSLLLAFALAAQLRVLTLKNIELNASLETKVATRTVELKEANLKLEKTNSDLIEANNAKGRFLATMSHEIRTPLTSIIGYADGILTGDIDKAEQERVTKIIAENGNHLLNVINDILDISKIDANKLEFESIPTPLFSVLAQVESLVGKRARDKGLAFYLNYQYPLPAHINTDPTRLKQILFNITNNAIKFTENGYIGLSVALVKNKLQITVKDSGEGISLEQQEKLFQPFTQADNSINRRFGGTGLGLSISQRLAKGLGGEITFESTLNKGSTFTLNIVVDVVENTSWINNVAEIWRSTPSRSIQPVKIPNFSGNTVLLADDHPNNRELISLLLKRMKIKVTKVENGQQALEVLYRQNFDLILLDIHMPIMDGTLALKQLRSTGNNTPVIALTANNMKHEIDEYMAIGFSEHLAKPIDRRDFIRKLSLFLTMQGDSEQVLSKEDMLNLVSEYQDNLREQLVKIDKALKQRDLSVVSEIAHNISGSAGSFGFALIGNKFANIEKSALQDDEIAIAFELPKILALAHQCTDLPCVNIPLGIVNHKNNVELFLKAIYEFAEDAEQIFIQLQDALINSETNSALVHLYRLLPNTHECALTEAESALKSMEVLITYGHTNVNEFKPYLNLIETQLRQLNNVLEPNLMN